MEGGRGGVRGLDAGGAQNDGKVRLLEGSCSMHAAGTVH